MFKIIATIALICAFAQMTTARSLMSRGHRYRVNLPVNRIVEDLDKIASGDQDLAVEGALNLSYLFPPNGKIERLSLFYSDSFAQGNAESSGYAGNTGENTSTSAKSKGNTVVASTGTVTRVDNNVALTNQVDSSSSNKRGSATSQVTGLVVGGTGSMSSTATTTVGGNTGTGKAQSRSNP